MEVNQGRSWGNGKKEGEEKQNERTGENSKWGRLASKGRGLGVLVWSWGGREVFGRFRKEEWEGWWGRGGGRKVRTPLETNDLRRFSQLSVAPFGNASSRHGGNESQVAPGCGMLDTTPSSENRGCLGTVGGGKNGGRTQLCPASEGRAAPDPIRHRGEQRRPWRWH